MVEDNGNRYLTVEEVAKRFGVNPGTVYRLAREGKIPGAKFGNQWRFSEARLEKWFANRDQINEPLE